MASYPCTHGEQFGPICLRQQLAAPCSPLRPSTSPSPPHRTVRDVLRHTALQCPSSGRIQRTSYAGSTQTKDSQLAEPRRRISCPPPSPYLPVLLAGKEREALVDVSVDLLEGMSRVALAEIRSPSPQDGGEPLDQDRNRRPWIPRR